MQQPLRDSPVRPTRQSAKLTTNTTLSGAAASVLTSRVTCTGDVSDVILADITARELTGTSTDTHMLSVAVVMSLARVAVMR